MSGSDATTADLLVEKLVEWGVSVVFGLPGDKISRILAKTLTYACFKQGYRLFCPLLVLRKGVLQPLAISGTGMIPTISNFSRKIQKRTANTGCAVATHSLRIFGRLFTGNSLSFESLPRPILKWHRLRSVTG